METLKIIFRFIWVLAIDLFLLRQVHFGAYIMPVLFPWLLLTMPLKTPRVKMLLMAFFTGLTVDLFMNTGGINAMSLTTATFIRPALLPLFFSSEDFDENLRPAINVPDFRRFLFFSFLFLLIFHLCWHTVMVARFSGIPVILLRTFSGTIQGLIIILVWEMLWHKSPGK